MQAFLLVLSLVIIAMATLIILYFLGNLQQIERNRANLTPRMVHIPQIVSPPVAENTEAENTPETAEIGETPPETAPVLTPAHVPPVEHTTPHEHEETHSHEPTAEKALAKKNKLRDMLIGGEVFD